MDIISGQKNFTTLLTALIDSFKEPTCLVDNLGNILLNQKAIELKNIGFDVDIHSKKIKANSTETVLYQGVKYNIEKKDINHGTNCCLCKIIPIDDTIARLTESSKKLKKVLSAL